MKVFLLLLVVCLSVPQFAHGGFVDWLNDNIVEPIKVGYEESMDYMKKLAVVYALLKRAENDKPKDMNEAIVYMCNRPVKKGYYERFAMLASESKIAEKMDLTKPIVFLVHGIEKLPVEVKHDYSSNVDANVCEIIWEQVEELTTWDTRKTRAAETAEHVAAFIKKLHENHNVDYGKISMVGHGLGAQIAGVVGHQISGGSENKGIGAIYALNPYGRRKIDKQHINERLSSDDANYVQAILTTDGEYLPNLAHQIFYPNLGKAPQLPCIYVDNNDDECNDKIAIQYFRYSLNKKNLFMGQQCPSREYYLTRQCYKKQDRMGIHAKKKVNGHFFFETFGAPPYTPRNYNELAEE